VLCKKHNNKTNKKTTQVSNYQRVHVVEEGGEFKLPYVSIQPPCSSQTLQFFQSSPQKIQVAIAKVNSEKPGLDNGFLSPNS